jgi:galactonate dehydratase
MNRRSMLAGLGAFGGALSLSSLARAVQEARSPYRRPKLKITDVRTAQVQAHGHQVHVRIYTDQGLVGQGEATDAAVGSPPLINGPFKRFLVGQDPLNVDSLFERIRTSGLFAGAQAGQYVTALSGIEIALWDLAGKALGVPVYQLLGGKTRD